MIFILFLRFKVGQSNHLFLFKKHKTTMIKYILGLTFIVFSSNLVAQKNADGWIFYKESDGISVYYKTNKNSHIKEMKLTTKVKSTVKKVSAFIINVDSLKTWGYGCMQSDLLKKLGDKELFYYYAVDVPWPFEDRDVVINMKISRDSISGITTINSRNSDGYLPEKSDRTRIKHVRAQWVLTPLEKNLMQIDFSIATDLGADFPDWIVNHALSYSPTKSMLALKNRLE